MTTTDELVNVLNVKVGDTVRAEYVTHGPHGATVKSAVTGTVWDRNTGNRHLGVKRMIGDRALVTAQRIYRTKPAWHDALVIEVAGRRYGLADRGAHLRWLPLGERYGEWYSDQQLANKGTVKVIIDSEGNAA